jgi:transmembrane sensor
MEKPQPVGLLEKYLAGNCTEEEAALVKNWYESFEYEDDLFSGLNEDEKQKLRDHMFGQILVNIGEMDTDGNIVKRSNVKKLYKWYATAAAAVILMVSGIVFYPRSKPADVQLAGNVQQYQNISNTTGQIYKVTLPDSSSVWMSPGAVLRYPKVFAAAARNVSMTGKCFFEVTKNTQRPFIINSNAIITKVWGTSFLVRDDGQSNIADVSVLTGKVSVSIRTNKSVANTQLKMDKGDVMIYPHQKAVYKVGEHVLEAEQQVTEPALQLWNRINLSFDNKLLKDIIPVLNKKFGVHIVVASEDLNRYMFNADLNGFNLPDVLTALKKSLNIDYQIADNNITLQQTN